MTKKEVDAIKEPGLHPIGDNLYVKINGGRSWVLRYFHAGKRRHMGLGSTALTPLAEARDKVVDAMRLLRTGVDPLDQKHAGTGPIVTFGEVLEQYLGKQAPEWKPGAEVKWRQEATKYLDVLATIPVAKIDDAAVMRVLEPIWLSKTTTAMRVRGKIESILTYATARKLRKGENPARWKGHLEELLAKPSLVAPAKPVEALAPRDMPELVAGLRKDGRLSAALAEFVVLTAVRSDEARLAVWSELDLEAKTWTIPAARMKAKVEHKVPLSSAAIAVLERPKEGPYIFGGANPIGHAAALEAVKRVSGKSDLTLHGARASFATWAGESTNFARDVVERCMGHATGNKVEQAYRRGEELEKRGAVMDAWATFLDQPAGATVVQMRRTK
jgi:integrase